MNDKPYTKIGDTYYPKPQVNEDSSTEIKGPYWRAWLSNKIYYYEYDIGHFATKFLTVEISQEDFLLLKSGELTETQLKNKYKNTCNIIKK